LQRKAISQEKFNRLGEHFYNRWQEEKVREQQKAKDTDSGPSYYVLRRMKLGQALMKVSDRLMRSGELSTTQAAQVLGVRALKVGNLLSQPYMS
jgi:hypothetical protein